MFALAISKSKDV